MNKAQISGMWDHFRTINGITLRAIKEIPSDRIDTRPVRDMRTPKELIIHMYKMLQAIAEGAVKGEVADYEAAEKGLCQSIKSHDELVRFASESWKAGDRAVQSLTDQQLAATVKTPWGFSPPGFICVNIIYDEHLHHRGQLYCYLRQMGVEPPFMWDFENNAPEFQPRAAQQV